MKADSTIEFEKKDFFPRDLMYFKKNIWNISEIIHRNPELITVMKEFLFSFVNNTDFRDRFKEWKIEVSKTKGLYKDKSYEDLLKELEKVYIHIKPDHVKDFRGIIFEDIMRKHYERKYSPKSNKLSYGCQIKLNGVNIEYIDFQNSQNNRKTVDIARYNPVSSEFHELKVGPKSFQDYNIKYLNILHKAINTNMISDKIDIGCVTLKGKSQLNLRLKMLKEDYSKLRLIGFEEIRKMLCES